MIIFQGLLSKCFHLTLLPALLLLLPSCLNAAQVTLAWDANSEPTVNGYNLYYGLESGNYSQIINVGFVTEYTIVNLLLNQNYYFVVTAYDIANESNFSNEIFYIETSPPPLPAKSGMISWQWVESSILYFEDFESDNNDWIDTMADNSMITDDSIFEIVNGFLSVTNTGINVHSHYNKNFTAPFIFTGKMQKNSGGIGITFLSDYPNSNLYYRFRSYNNSDPFNISPHGTSVTCQTHSSIIPILGQWYQFKIEILVENIKAKIWLDGQIEPTWQIDCITLNPILSQGKIGVWSMLSNDNLWDDLKVQK